VASLDLATCSHGGEPTASRDLMCPRCGKKLMCMLNPSMYRAYCAHCQGTARGTRDNPIFSIRTFWFKENPMVEILKDGASVGGWDSNFQFGMRKAEMLLACVELLRKFWRSGDEQRLKFPPQIVSSPENRLKIELLVLMEPYFQRSDGVVIDRPFLRLQAVEPHREHIGVGALKCRAVCDVEEQLRDWVRKNHR
jgi:DNA-directed RNA polymerase subunit RPC12/RpoP